MGEGFNRRLVVVVPTDRGDNIRIISARRANRQERKFYEGETEQDQPKWNARRLQFLARPTWKICAALFGRNERGSPCARRRKGFFKLEKSKRVAPKTHSSRSVDMKQSGVGREDGKVALNLLREPKNLW